MFCIQSPILPRVRGVWYVQDAGWPVKRVVRCTSVSHLVDGRVGYSGVSRRYLRGIGKKEEEDEIYHLGWGGATRCDGSQYEC